MKDRIYTYHISLDRIVDFSKFESAGLIGKKVSKFRVDEENPLFPDYDCDVDVLICAVRDFWQDELGNPLKIAIFQRYLEKPDYEKLINKKLGKLGEGYFDGITEEGYPVYYIPYLEEYVQKLNK